MLHRNTLTDIWFAESIFLQSSMHVRSSELEWRLYLSLYRSCSYRLSVVIQAACTDDQDFRNTGRHCVHWASCRPVSQPRSTGAFFIHWINVRKWSIFLKCGLHSGVFTPY